MIEEERVDAELLRVKQFVGVDTDAPLEGLRRRNARRFKIRPQGWPMKRRRYEELVELVRPDVAELVRMLEAAGKLASADGWWARWQQIWDENLESCDKKGMCNIVLS